MNDCQCDRVPKRNRPNRPNRLGQNFAQSFAQGGNINIADLLGEVGRIANEDTFEDNEEEGGIEGRSADCSFREVKSQNQFCLLVFCNYQANIATHLIHFDMIDIKG